VKVLQPDGMRVVKGAHWEWYIPDGMRDNEGVHSLGWTSVWKRVGWSGIVVGRVSHLGSVVIVRDTLSCGYRAPN
jgi:hypothetical protein